MPTCCAHLHVTLKGHVASLDSNILKFGFFLSFSVDEMMGFKTHYPKICYLSILNILS